MVKFLPHKSQMADRYKCLSGIWAPGTRLNRGSQGADPLHSPGLQDEHAEGGVRTGHVSQDIHCRCTNVEVVPAFCHFIHPPLSQKYNLFSLCPCECIQQGSWACFAANHLNPLWESVSISTIRCGQSRFLCWFASLPNIILSQKNAYKKFSLKTPFCACIHSSYRIKLRLWLLQPPYKLAQIKQASRTKALNHGKPKWLFRKINFLVYSSRKSSNVTKLMGVAKILNLFTMKVASRNK